MDLTDLVAGEYCYVVGEPRTVMDINYAKRELESVECSTPTSAPEVLFTETTFLNTDQKIEVSFAGSANVEIYTVSGILVVSEVADSYFSCPLQAGVYLVRINGQISKVLVK
ncbi:MAG: T9SS type A sorting domain-containing protein [Candidatus Azobacteroides sp.]|nr:T9SS type A sorting domain-containing protein [Candidatus Azobacteroides sp.]